ncbi:MAG: hypothetical protein AAF573_06490 [Bacteroidota bacterium]
MKNILHSVKLFVLGLCISVVGLTSCEETPSQPTTPSQDPDISVEKPSAPSSSTTKSIDTRAVTYLRGLYATSNNSAVFNALDGKTTTAWKTTKGASPDEKVVLLFQKPTYLKKVEVLAAKGDGLADVLDFFIHINGKPFGLGGIETTEIEQEVSSLSIHIGRTGALEKINVAEAGKNGKVIRFSKDLAVGISEIKLWGEDGNAMSVVPPRKVKATVNASSTLSPVSSYGVAHLFDNKIEYAWVEGVDGYGEDEQINFQLQEEVDIEKIQVWNGYQRSPNHYRNNSRVKGFSLGNTTGKSYDYTLRDDDAPQMIDMKVSLESKDFTFKINSAYEGKRYADLAVSELLFFEPTDNGFRPLQLEVVNNSVPQMITQKSKGTLLEPLLNNRIANEMEYTLSGFYAERSIVLRSNGTFSLSLMESVEDDDAYTSVADGHWEIITVNGGSAQVKLSGILTDLSAMLAEEQGRNEQAQVIQPFTDVLTITKDKISGEKVFDEILVR